MGHVREIFGEFERRGAGVAVVMAESYERMRRFLAGRGYPFPLLSDVRREVTRAYGVYVRLNFESVNISRPAEFVIDTGKIIRYIYVGSIQTDFPPDEEVLTALDGLSG